MRQAPLGEESRTEQCVTHSHFSMNQSMRVSFNKHARVIHTCDSASSMKEASARSSVRPPDLRRQSCSHSVARGACPLQCRRTKPPSWTYREGSWLVPELFGNGLTFMKATQPVANVVPLGPPVGRDNVVHSTTEPQRNLGNNAVEVCVPGPAVNDALYHTLSITAKDQLAKVVLQLWKPVNH